MLVLVLVGDGRRAVGDGSGGDSCSGLHNNFSFSTVFVTIRGNKNTYLQARGRNAPEPLPLLPLLLPLLPRLVLFGGR